MSEGKTYRIMISGGGTGGHVYPAISIAQALKAEVENLEVLFVGAKGKMEMTKVPEAGFEIIGLWISGIQRKLSLQNLLFPFKVISSLMKSFGLIRKFRPDVVVGVGGYASGPLLYAATVKKVPTLIQEQNSYAGLTNKLLAKRVNKICVAHEGMERYFPVAKLVVAGNPVRDGLVWPSDQLAEAYKHFEFNANRPVVLMTGGSLGARTLNEAMLASLEGFVDNGIQIIWQTGGFYFEEMKRRSAEFDMRNVRIMDFLKEMNMAYAIANVVVSRAGALSIAELELTGKATILIPSPNVAEDHQSKNAQALVERDAALLIKDGEAVSELAGAVIELLGDERRISELEANIRSLARPDASGTIAKEVLKLAS